MKRTKLDDRVLPTYTKGEEIFNMVSHIVGGAIGIAVLTLCVIFAAIHKDGYALAAGIVYGVTVIILYTMSSIYHGLRTGSVAKRVFRIIDHCSIYLLIAGTYTPFTLCTLREYNIALGWIIFGIVWGFTIIGIVLTAIDIKKYKVFSMICYLVMGWCIIFKINIVYNALGLIGFLLLLIGGIVYTIGAVIYGLGKKFKWMHSIFHICCIIGTTMQALCILLYVI